jgi:glycerol-3-phosphate O-acyltransferase
LKQENQPNWIEKLRLRWYELLRDILSLWVKPKIKADADGNIATDGTKPVCYMMDSYALSSVLILDKICEQRNLARPLLPITRVAGGPHRSYGVLKRLTGLIFRRFTPRRRFRILDFLVEKTWQDPELDILLVPVTVLVGQRPSRESGLTRTLFAENWEIAGRMRRFFSTLVNGRKTFVQFSRPISLRELANEGLEAPVALRKVSRILRVHFKRVRTAAIGPDLSHRRTMVDRVLNAPTVTAAIKDKARRNGIPLEKARRIAHKYINEIAANYSYSTIVVAEALVAWFWNRIYNGIRVNHFEDLQHHAFGHEVIYVPCHRSHLDYVLLSYLVHEHGSIPPHIAAGVNLNLPLVGSMLRRCGAFYLRRSFRSQKLYAAVFYEYLSMIQTQGVSIEYFIEGTRSRTGRSLPPKGGMLAMSVRSYLNAPVRPIVFEPVYIGYERLVEGDSYSKELSGKAKRSERFTDLIKIFGIARHNYGEAHVSLGQPIYLDDLLREQDPEWQETIRKQAKRPVWLNATIDELGRRIMTNINASADVNPVNLLAVVLLGTPRHAMGEKQLARQIALYKELLTNRPTPERVTITGKDPQQIIRYGFEMKILQRKQHSLGDIVSIQPDQAVGLTFFRNNIAHLMALPSLIACCFLEHRNFRVAHLHKFATIIHPFLESELFIPWKPEEIEGALDASIEQLVRHGLLVRREDGETLSRARDNPEAVMQLNVLAHCLLQTLHRYLITILVLARYGSGELSRAELERLCIQTAQRISMLHEFDAPEFYDKALFREFIAQLMKTRYLSVNKENHLVYDRRLEKISEDAKYILGEDIRLEIDRHTPHAKQDEPATQE